MTMEGRSIPGIGRDLGVEGPSAVRKEAEVRELSFDEIRLVTGGAESSNGGGGCGGWNA